MINPPTGSYTTMDAVQDGIVAALRTRFGSKVKTIGAYEAFIEGSTTAQDTLQTPALFLEVEDFDVVNDQPDGWGRAELNCSLAVHCILGFETPHLQRSLVQLAASVATLVMPELRGDEITRGNLWSLGGAAAYPEGVSAQPGLLVPGLNGKDSWVVRWSQSFFLLDELPG